MKWTYTTDVEEYASAAEPWLLRDPVRNTVPLTVLRGIRGGQFAQAALMGWAVDAGEVVGAVSHTPPYPLLLGEVPLAALPPLARDLIEIDHAIPGVAGPMPVVEAFARSWWRPEHGRRSERLFRLGTLESASAPGRARTATLADLALAVLWFREFQEEAHVDRAA